MPSDSVSYEALFTLTIESRKFSANDFEFLKREGTNRTAGFFAPTSKAPISDSSDASFSDKLLLGYGL